MKDVIYFALITGLFVLNLKWAYKSRDKDNFVYRLVLFTRHKDWLYAIALIAFIITLGGVVEPYVPEFLRWSVFSIFGKDGTNGNIAILDVISGSGSSSSGTPADPGIIGRIVSSVLLLTFLTIFVLILPKAAYWEEKRFRYGMTEYNKEMIYRSMKFGLVHCFIGVPLWIGLLLGVGGIIFSIRYIRTYKKICGYAILNKEYPHEMALASTTSLHGKYNIILVFVVTLSYFISIF